MSTSAGAPPTGLLRGLTRLQHVLFAALALIGAVQAWRSGAHRVLLVLTVLVLAGWYAVGASHAAHRQFSTPPPGVGPATPGLGHAPPARLARDDPEPSSAGREAMAWLVVLALFWGVAVLVSPAFVWVAFTLWLLAGHLLPLRWAVVFSVAVLTVVVLVPPLSGQPWSIAGVVGPSVGALFALVLSRGQVLLARDALERARLVDSLVAAQSETASLQTQLLQVQREAGVLAERTRLSRDIHDTLAQGFSSIVLLARGSAGVPDEGGLRDVLGGIERTAGDNLAESRRIVAALAPKSLVDSGLGAALRALLDDLAQAGIGTRLRLDQENPRLPTDAEVALLRTAQGALANVRAHSGARTVVVTVAGSDTEVRLDVVDDGTGFDPSQLGEPPHTPAHGGYGLLGMRSRLRELGGDLVVESAPGDGTAISAHLPIASARPQLCSTAGQP
ncbi:MAG: sensor histidine kinase [Tetrasphaera sp.]